MANSRSCRLDTAGIAELVEACKQLDDPTRAEELAATIKLFELILRLEGQEFANGWIRRQTELIRGEAQDTS